MCSDVNEYGIPYSVPVYTPVFITPDVAPVAPVVPDSSLRGNRT
jgi:hypothetical protein